MIAAIEEYIRYYNTGRYQIKLNSMTPMEFHQAYAA
ncbi:IS3 family transposase [Ruminococcus albus]